MHLHYNSFDHGAHHMVRGAGFNCTFLDESTFEDLRKCKFLAQLLQGHDGIHAVCNVCNVTSTRENVHLRVICSCKLLTTHPKHNLSRNTTRTSEHTPQYFYGSGNGNRVPTPHFTLRGRLSHARRGIKSSKFSVRSFGVDVLSKGQLQ